MKERVAMAGTLLLVGWCLTGSFPFAFPPIAAALPETGCAIALSSTSPPSGTIRPGVVLKTSRCITLAVGKSASLEATLPPSQLSWKSGNAAVATVNESGVVLARHAGMVRIVAEDATSLKSAACIVKVYEKRTQKQARKTILKLKKRYRTGRRWTNSNYYFWQAANCHCYGCAAFAGIASDTTFGKFAPITRHTKFSRIRAGDHVRIGKRHSVVVIRKKKKHIVVAEGNYGRTFKWGRKISYAQLRKKGFYVETRY